MGDYQTTINSILTNQRQLMSGVNNVYPGFSLNNLVSDAQRQQRQNIAGITNSAEDANIQKHLNLAQLYGDKYDVLNTNIKLMADNNDMFLTNFNENTEKIDQLNNVISTKNKIIQIPCPLFVPLIEEGEIDGEIIENKIIKENHKIALTKNASGVIFLKKKSAADTIENIFTNIIIIFISLRVIK